MIEESAVVVACDGDYAWVEAQRKTACGQCQVNKVCGTSVLAQLVGRKTTRLRALNQARARVGDTVIIGLHESAMLTGSLAVYLVPLLVMLVFAMLGQSVAEHMLIRQTDLTSILFALGGLGIAVIWLRRFTRRIQDDTRYQPVVLKRVGAATISPVF